MGSEPTMRVPMLSDGMDSHTLAVVLIMTEGDPVPRFLNRESWGLDDFCGSEDPGFQPGMFCDPEHSPRKLVMPAWGAQLVAADYCDERNRAAALLYKPIARQRLFIFPHHRGQKNEVLVCRALAASMAAAGGV